ncbi:hypothetical protein ACLK1T_05345 [Escherichia coli]
MRFASTLENMGVSFINAIVTTSSPSCRCW